MGNQIGKSVNRIADRERRCGPRGSHASVDDRTAFIVDRIAEGWTQEDCAWALGISLKAVEHRLWQHRYTRGLVGVCLIAGPAPLRYLLVQGRLTVWYGEATKDAPPEAIQGEVVLDHGEWCFRPEPPLKAVA